MLRFRHSHLARRLDGLVKGRLWLQVALGLVAGAGVGILLGPDLNWVSRGVAETLGDWFALPGKLFLAAVGMVVIPLAASSIIWGIAGGGGGEQMRHLAWRLGVFVLATTAFSAMVGLSLARLARPPGPPAWDARWPSPRVKPEANAYVEAPASGLQALTRDLPDRIAGLIPQNITQSLFEQDMLAIVVFSILIGAAVVAADKREITKPLIGLVEAVLEVCMTVIRFAMRFAPIAVFGLMAQTVAANGWSTLSDLAQYCGVVVAGLLVLVLAYVAIAIIWGRIGPGRFLRAIAPVQLMAFSTSSSAAVMPLTMRTAVEKLGAPASIAGAVVPLAATVNMAGTALYQSVAIVFLAELGGRSLTLEELTLIMITLTGASIGAPAAPGASIAILASTATSFGVPLAGLPLILGVDRLLDMARTAVNVTGDLVACRILAHGVSAIHAEPAPAADRARAMG
ncbi:MAG: dicarboxylate/amino acid:cation symporter [Maricaulaceae bacterium]